MPKNKFKVYPTIVDSTVFVEGPGDLMIGVDYGESVVIGPKQAKQTAKKLTALLNKHWDDDKKAKAK